MLINLSAIQYDHRIIIFLFFISFTCKKSCLVISFLWLRCNVSTFRRYLSCRCRRPFFFIYIYSYCIEVIRRHAREGCDVAAPCSHLAVKLGEYRCRRSSGTCERDSCIFLLQKHSSIFLHDTILLETRFQLRSISSCKCWSLKPSNRGRL